MKKSLLIVFVVVVTIPLFVMTLMGVTSYVRERETTTERFGILARAQLQEIDRLLINHIRSIEEQMIELLAETDTELRRRAIRRSSVVRRIFEIGTDGTIIFPPEDGSVEEQQFLSWAGEVELPATLSIRSGETAAGRPADRGWHTWFMGDGLNLLFWRSTAQSIIQGVVLERIALIAGIAAALPGSDPEDSSELSTRITLSDARGEVLYQWGLYSPSSEAALLAEITLSPPLGAWHLRLYLDTTSDRVGRDTRQYFSLMSGIVALALVLVFLAYYFYRENAKVVRDALQKVSFVNQVSHELKTPLTNIRLYAEILAGRLERKQDQEDVEVIIGESGRLGRMINNVLTFAREGKSGFEISLEQTSIDEVVRRVLASFSPSLTVKNFRVETDLDAAAAINTDPDLVEQILSNVVSNVEKYAGSGKYLQVESFLVQGAAKVTVSDNGPGIAAKEQKNIFKPFYRVSNSLTDGVSGAGIGLAVSRSLAEKLGGSLVLKPGNGAVFVLTIADMEES